MSTHEDLVAFLTMVKKCNYIHIVDREKNKETRYQLGITIEDQEDMIRNLAIEDYLSGPAPDEDVRRKQIVWKFKTRFEKHTIYIKVTEIKRCEENSYTVAISCHIDDYEY